MTRDYYGTKRIRAFEQMRQPVGSDGLGDGLLVDDYGVIYPDGYQSWSPKAAFEKAYQPLNALSFGHAVQAMFAGSSVNTKARSGSGWGFALDGDKKL